jgi:hypothetical protein
MLQPLELSPSPVPPTTRKKLVEDAWNIYRSFEANASAWKHLQKHKIFTQARRLISTTNGRVGLVPERAEKGDAICILHGSHVPVSLRKNADGETYEVIGQCYLEGVMYGEAVTWEEDEADTFLLK